MKNLVCCISLALLAAGGASAQNYIGDARSFNPLGLWELAANGPQAGTTVPSVTDFGTHGNNLSINGSLSATGSLASSDRNGIGQFHRSRAVLFHSRRQRGRLQLHTHTEVHGDGLGQNHHAGDRFPGDCGKV